MYLFYVFIKYSTYLDKYKRVQKLDQATGVILRLVKTSNSYFQSAFIFVFNYYFNQQLMPVLEPFSLLSFVLPVHHKHSNIYIK